MTARPPLAVDRPLAAVGDTITYRLPRGPVRTGTVAAVMPRAAAYVVDVIIPAARGRAAYRTRTVVRAGWLRP